MTFRFSPRPNRASEIGWREWSERAFQEAQVSDKPVLLAISAVWCQTAEPRMPPPARSDRFGDPLPAGVLARMGSVRLDCEESIYAAAFTPDGKSVAIGRAGETEKGKIVLFDAASGKKMQELNGHLGGTNDMTFAADGKHLVVWVVACKREAVHEDLDDERPNQ